MNNNRDKHPNCQLGNIKKIKLFLKKKLYWTEYIIYYLYEELQYVKHNKHLMSLKVNTVLP